MTSEDNVGPRICGPCRWEFHDHCRSDEWCECLATYCYEAALEDP